MDCTSLSITLLAFIMSVFSGLSDLLSQKITITITLIVLFLAALGHFTYWSITRDPIPISVNYHFTRKCNKECGFCFHTAKTSHKAPLEEAKHGLVLLKDAGMKKLNFAGGEPFLYPKYLGMFRMSPWLESLSHRCFRV